MRLTAVPTTADLSEAYEALTWRGATTTVLDWLKWAQWSRLDARLGEILVKAIVNHFRDVNPFELWRTNRGCIQPQVLLVVLEFARIRARRDLSAQDFYEFQQWSAILFEGTVRAPFQSFFLPGGFPKPGQALKIVATSSQPFLKWGFFGVENLAPSKNRTGDATLLKKAQRARILRSLLEQGGIITVTDYIFACGGCVHRRMAERDLLQVKGVRAAGFTRGKRYQIKRRPESA